jgi:hypothetical protein
MPLKEELAWLKEQAEWRQKWCKEGIRGGHSTESCARWREDLIMLAAIMERLEDPMPLFRATQAAAAPPQAPATD